MLVIPLSDVSNFPTPSPHQEFCVGTFPFCELIFNVIKEKSTFLVNLPVMETRIIYSVFVPTCHKLLGTCSRQNSSEEICLLHGLQNSSLHHVGLWQGEKVKTVKKQLPLEYGFGLWLIPLSGQEILGWSNAGCKPGELPWKPEIWPIDYYITIFI